MKIMKINGENLLKRYNHNTLAVKDITFEVASGSVTAFLGPNGAGKTTTIGMLTGLLEKTGGKIFYDNIEFNRNEPRLKNIIGVVPQHNNIDKDLTVYQNLKSHAIMFNTHKKFINNKIYEILKFTGLTEHKNKKGSDLSGGMKRRLVIGRAMLHDPKVIFLDEPTTGLDPATRRHIWDFVNQINKNYNVTVVLTTHYIEEADKLADFIYFIDKGEIIKSGQPQQLKDEIGKYTLEIFTNDKIVEEFFNSRQECLDKMNQIKSPAKIREVNLEDVYLKITGRRIDI